MDKIETVIIGSGHAGLTMSYYLGQLGREHLILERGRIAERWRSERWDSFFFQFPNWTIELPGYKYRSEDPDGFVPGSEIVRFVQDYAAFIKAPVRCGTEVTSLCDSGNGHYLVQTGSSAIEAANVVIATGPYQRGFIPGVSAKVPKNVFQVHSNGYRNAEQLPDGAVLVVGAGSSGCQIAEDLNQSGRQVYLSVGRHLRVPRRYRRRDYGYWRLVMGGWERTIDSLPPGTKNMPTPLLTGFKGGHDVDFRRMAGDGILLLGRLEDLHDDTFIFAADLEQNLAKGDKWFNDFKTSVDEYIAQNEVAVPDDTQPNFEISAGKEIGTQVSESSLKASEISSIVWATGFQYELGWVKVPILDEIGAPIHRRGVTAAPGIYFLGLKFLYKLKSAFLSIAGGAEDAAYLAEQITNERKHG